MHSSLPKRTAGAIATALALLAVPLPARVHAAPPGPWERISYNELPRPGAAWAYDPVRHRMIYYGDIYDSPVGYQTQIFTVMALSLGPNPTWTVIHPAGPTPETREWPSMIYDPIGDRMLMFGGHSASFDRNDLWALSLDANPTWSQIIAGGALPYGHSGHTAIYDPVGQRMIVHGGYGTQTDVLALSLTGTPTWTQIIPKGPVIGHVNHTAVYDPVGQRMIVDGGFFMWDGAGVDHSNETWALSLDATPTWSRLTPASGLPPVHRYHGAICDPVRNTLVIVGGLANGSSDSNETWELSLGADPEWTPRTPVAGLPPVRQFPLTTYDPVDDRMIMFGGWASAHALDDTWSFALGANPAWTQLAPEGSPPNLVHFPTVVLDPTDGSILVYGGVPATTKPATELSAFPLSGPPVWRDLRPTGPIPPTPSRHSAIVDAAHTRMIVFGGTRNADGVTTNETWALSLGSSPAWSQLAPGGTPPDPRHSHSAIYDAANQRMIVFGGETPGVGKRNDVWALSLDASPTWSPVTVSGMEPDPRARHSAAYDPAYGRMIIFGGEESFGRTNFTYSLTLGPSPAWSQIPSSAPALADASMIYDPIGQRLVVFGGDDGFYMSDDTWILRLWTSPPTWSDQAVAGALPFPRYAHGAVYDAALGRMVVHGGSLWYPHDFNAAADTWSLPLASCPPPLVTVQPVPLALPYGATAVFSVTTTGVVSYRWQKNGTPMNNGGRISGVLTNTLTITNFQAPDVANYSVEVVGACGNDRNESQTAALTHAPMISCFGPLAPPPSGMAAWWAMDPGPGNTSPDVLHPVGNKNHASLTGAASLVSGKVGTAVRCEGVDDGLHVPSTLSPRLAANSTGLSIDAWILPRSGSSASAYRMILQKGLLRHASTTVNGATALAPGYAFYLHGGGKLGFQMPDTQFNPVRFEPAMAAMSMDSWHHVAVTVDPLTADGGKFYLDGVAVGTFTAASGILGNLADLYIGRFTPQLGPATADSAFHGDIDEVEIFVVAIDSSAVRKIWSAGCSGKRRVQVLTPSVTELRKNTAAAEICSAVQNLSSAARDYSWSIAATGPAAGCPSSVPVTFAPSSGSVSVAAGERAEITSLASVDAGALTAPFVRCFRLTVTDLSDGGVLTADAAVTYTGSPVTGQASCTPPEIGGARFTWEERIQAGSGLAAFTIHNDSKSGVALDYTIGTRDPETGAASAVLSLGGLAAGVPVTGSVFVPALGSVQVPVNVELDEYQPFLPDEIVLSADRDGDLVFEDLAAAHVASGEDTSLALVDVDPPGETSTGNVSLRLRAAPNPFGGSTALFFTLARAGRVDVAVFDVTGRQARRLLAGPLEPGEHRVEWDGRDDAGVQRGAGLYLARVRVGSIESVARILRIR